MRDLYEKSITRNKITEFKITELCSKLTEIDKIKSEITSLLDKLCEVDVSPSMGTMGNGPVTLEKGPSSDTSGQKNGTFSKQT